MIHATLVGMVIIPLTNSQKTRKKEIQMAEKYLMNLKLKKRNAVFANRVDFGFLFSQDRPQHEQI